MVLFSCSIFYSTLIKLPVLYQFFMVLYACTLVICIFVYSRFLFRPNAQS